MINNVVLAGNLARDPELRKTQTGKSVVNFSIAVSKGYQREGEPDADFFNVVAWDQRADFVARYMHKGDKVAVTGNLQTRSYEDKSGNMVYVTEVNAFNVTALESKAQKEARQAASGQYQGGGQQQEYYEEEDEEFGGPTLDITSDDLPF